MVTLSRGKIYLASFPRILVKITPERITLSPASSFVAELEDETFLPWLEAYAEKRHLCHSFDLSSLPPFVQKVLTHLQTIPFGKTESYQEVAIALKNPLAARAVGNGCRVNPFPLLIPCHRVISSTDRGIGGFSGGLEIKRRLLAFEAT